MGPELLFRVSRAVGGVPAEEELRGDRNKDRQLRSIQKSCSEAVSRFSRGLRQRKFKEGRGKWAESEAEPKTSDGYRPAKSLL